MDLWSKLHLIFLEILVIVSAVATFLHIVHFYIKNSRQFEKEYKLSHGKYDWLIWPPLD